MRPENAFIFLLGFMGIIGVASAIDVSSCQVIDSSGVYALNQDVSGAILVNGLRANTNACILVASSDVEFDCNGHSIANNGTLAAAGIGVNGSLGVDYTNLTIQNCDNVSDYYYGVMVADTHDVLLRNVSVYNSTRTAFTAYSTQNVNFTNDYAYNNGWYAFDIDRTTYSYVTGSYAQSNLLNDIQIASTASMYNVIDNNTIIGGGSGGINVGGSNNTISDNLVQDKPVTFAISIGGGDNNITGNLVQNMSSFGCRGFSVVGAFAFNNNFTNNTVRDSIECNGFYIDARANAFSENIVHGLLYGFNIRSTGRQNVFTDNTAYDNYNGLYNWRGGANVYTRLHAYNNTNEDVRVEASSTAMPITFNDLILDNPLGNMQNYTILDITDTALGEVYTIQWASNASAIPSDYETIFAGKYIDITPSGAVSIDSITWTYDDSEVVAGNYAEASLTLMKESGTWSDAGATFDPLANTFTIIGLNPASGYSILGNFTNSTDIELFGANLTNVSHIDKYVGAAAENVTTEGGNVSGVNVSATQLTDRWAAFFGDVVGNIYLNDAAGLSVYTWTWSPSNGGTICLSTNSSIGAVQVYGAVGYDIDGAWGFQPTVTDSGTNTFNNTNCTLNIGSSSVTASYADTGPAGGFLTCAIKTISPIPPTSGELLFCTEILPGGTLYNGGTGDFEVMVPTNETGTETYYFYANLG